MDFIYATIMHSHFLFNATDWVSIHLSLRPPAGLAAKGGHGRKVFLGIQELRGEGRNEFTTEGDQRKSDLVKRIVRFVVLLETQSNAIKS